MNYFMAAENFINKISSENLSTALLSMKEGMAKANQRMENMTKYVSSKNNYLTVETPV